jgi:hypothetical protein
MDKYMVVAWHINDDEAKYFIVERRHESVKHLAGSGTVVAVCSGATTANNLCNKLNNEAKP